MLSRLSAVSRGCTLLLLVRVCTSPFLFCCRLATFCFRFHPFLSLAHARLPPRGRDFVFCRQRNEAKKSVTNSTPAQHPQSPSSNRSFASALHS
uniref:Putative secreted protein n=1 Tax=Ixodes ricinus TaxID=34613 RepID=A0A6B0UEG2_IXORI